MLERSIRHAWKAMRATLTERYGNTSSRNQFNNFPPQNASRWDAVNVGVCRRFRGHLTQFLHSSEGHFYEYPGVRIGVSQEGPVDDGMCSTRCSLLRERSGYYGAVSGCGAGRHTGSRSVGRTNGLSKRSHFRRSILHRTQRLRPTPSHDALVSTNPRGRLNSGDLFTPNSS